MKHAWLVSTVLSGAMLVLGIGQANAQRDVSMRVPEAERAGLTFGLSIGRGSIDVECDRCDNVAPLTEALSLTGHVGVMLTPKIGLLAEHWTVRYNDRGSEWFDDSEDHLVAQRIVAAAGQMWLVDRLWVKAGVGYGWHISDSHYARAPSPAPGDGPRPAASGGAQQPVDEPSHGSLAYFTAIGFEYAHTTTFAADVQFRVGATRRPSDEYQIYNTGLNFGLSWY